VRSKVPRVLRFRSLAGIPAKAVPKSKKKASRRSREA